MHTATQFNLGMFDLEVEGEKVDAPQALGGYGRLDRLGVVVTSALGGVGASLLIQLAIARFYDLRPERRDGNPIYPEIYLFHVGGRCGMHTNYDFWPPRKEPLVSGDGARVLTEINDRGITHLAVPDGQADESVEHFFKEANAARDRLVRCFAYSPEGRVDGATLTIRALDAALAANTAATLDPRALGRVLRNAVQQPERLPPAMARDMRVALEDYEERHDEVSLETCRAIRERRKSIEVEGLPVESYRTISADEALVRLGP